MSTHTPGPWEAAKESSSYNYAIFGPQTQDIIAHVIDAALPDEVCTANARLIASAPDLLAACEAAEELLHFHSESAKPMGLHGIPQITVNAEDWLELLATVSAAIQKAREA